MRNGVLTCEHDHARSGSESAGTGRLQRTGDADHDQASVRLVRSFGVRDAHRGVYVVAGPHGRPRQLGGRAARMWLGPYGAALLGALLLAVIVMLAIVATRLVRREVDVDVDARLSDLALIDELNAAANAGASRGRTPPCAAERHRGTCLSRGATVYVLDSDGEHLTVLTNQSGAMDRAGVLLPPGTSRPRVRSSRGVPGTVGCWLVSSPGSRTTPRRMSIVAMANDFEGAESYAALLPANTAWARCALGDDDSYRLRGTHLGLIDVRGPSRSPKTSWSGSASSAKDDGHPGQDRRGRRGAAPQ